MRKLPDSFDIARACVLLCAVTAVTGSAFAQGRGGGGAWTTGDFDAQRTSWVRSDSRLTPDNFQKSFKFLWKFKIPNDPTQLNSLTQAVMLDGLHSYTGMRSMLVMGASSGAAYSVDADLGRQEWKHAFTTAAVPAGTLACPGGVTASFTRQVSLAAAPAPAAGGRGVVAAGGRGGRTSGGSVGLPDQGAPNLDAGSTRGGGGRGGAAGASGAAVAGGRGGGGRGGGAAGASGAVAGGRGGRGGGAVAIAAPAGDGEEGTVPAAPAGGRGGGRGAIALGSYDAFYSVSGDGMMHALNVMDGTDLVPPVTFLPANANVSGLMLFDRVLYAATRNNCGGAANGLWAIDLASPQKTVTTWKSNGGGDAGMVGPAAGTDGTLYLATADGEYSATNFSDSVVSLEPKTLKMKDYFTPGKTPFASSPTIFPGGGQDWIAAAGKDGRLYLLDSKSLGGADHHTPASSTAKYTDVSTDFTAGALATWQDPEGTRWILAPAGGPLAAGSGFTASNGAVTNGAIVAFKVVSQNGKPTLQPGWVSRDMVSPATPMIVNGIIFALGTGEFHTNDATVTAAQRAQRSKPAVLYALDPATGKELWNSGNTITSFVHSAGLSNGNGQVYVATWDSTLYTFGIPMER